MKRRDRKARKQAVKPPPFVRAAIARLGRKHEERLLRDADELHRRQRQPCDVTSRREAREIWSTFMGEML